jgi:hypothetical protein
VHLRRRDLQQREHPVPFRADAPLLRLFVCFERGGPRPNMRHNVSSNGYGVRASKRHVELEHVGVRLGEEAAFARVRGGAPQRLTPPGEIRALPRTIEILCSLVTLLYARGGGTEVCVE